MDENRFAKKDDKKVAIRKSLLIGLVTALGLALLALTFYIGRESARTETQSPEDSPEKVEVLPVPQSAVPYENEAEPEVGIPESPSLPTAAAAPDELAAPLPPAGQEVLAESATASPENTAKEAVRSYFEKIAAIQPNQLGGDVSAMANEIMGALTLGDSSGLDNLIRQSEDAKENLAALTPPPPCENYHQLMLASIDDGLELMQTLKTAVIESDMEALTELAAKGRLLQSRSEALTREENAIRQRFGLPH